jgi:hypothetical protein
MIVFCVIIDYAMDNDSQKTTKSIVIIAIVAALAVLGIVVLTVTVTIPMQQQQAEAVGCKNSIAFNASKGRCFQP